MPYFNGYINNKKQTTLGNFILAFVILFGLLLLSRILTEKAYQRLESEKKDELAQISSKDKIFAFAIILLLLLFIGLSIYFKWLDIMLLNFLFIISVLLFILVMSVRSIFRLRQRSFPGYYLRALFLAVLARFVGLVLFFLILWW